MEQNKKNKSRTFQEAFSRAGLVLLSVLLPFVAYLSKKTTINIDKHFDDHNRKIEYYSMLAAPSPNINPLLLSQDRLYIHQDRSREFYPSNISLSNLSFPPFKSDIYYYDKEGDGKIDKIGISGGIEEVPQKKEYLENANKRYEDFRVKYSKKIQEAEKKLEKKVEQDKVKEQKRLDNLFLKD